MKLTKEVSIERRNKIAQSIDLLGLSRAQVARLVGISPALLTKYLRGTARFGIERAEQIETVLADYAKQYPKAIKAKLAQAENSASIVLNLLKIAEKEQYE